jgi:antitoxin VapB
VALHIENPELERLVRELAEATGEPIDEAMRGAVRARLQQARDEAAFLDRIHALQAKVRELPVYDDRSPDEMLYDHDGLPH